MALDAASRLAPFVRASALHIGAAAATAALREDLVREHGVQSEDIDRAYAVARVTPGTNLLAVYAVLAHRLGGWSLALQAVAVGAFVPATVAILVATVYVHVAAPWVGALMGGARAGGVAVFIGAAVRLARPHLKQHHLKAGFVVTVAFVLGSFTGISLFVVLLGAAALGAVLLRPRT